MSYAERIKTCKSQPEAMLVIAEGIDEILLGAGTIPKADEWGTWGDAEQQQQHVGSVAPAPSPFEAIEVPVDPAEVARYQALYDEAELSFESGRRAGLSPDQLVTIAQERDGYAGRLRNAKNPGKMVNLDTPGDPHYVEVLGTDGDGVTYDIPAVSEEKQARRYTFAGTAGIHQYFPPSQAGDESFVEELRAGYAKGGPMWLYLGNPELVYKMPMAHKQAMAADLAEENPRVAYEFARDVCKVEDEGDPGAAQDWIHALSDFGGTPYKGKGEG